MSQRAKPKPRPAPPPLEVNFRTSEDDGRVVLRFRYQRLDDTEIGPSDGVTLEHFAAMLVAVGQALKSGRTAADIQAAVNTAVERFEKSLAAKTAATTQQERATHG